LFIVDISATAAASSERLSARQVVLRRPVSSHKCMEVDGTPHLGSSTFLVVSATTKMADGHVEEGSCGCRICAT